MTPRRHIHRIDRNSRRGWYVRIRYRQRGRTVLAEAYFADSLHRGQRRALAAARRFRDRQLRAHKHDRVFFRLRVKNRPQPNSKTGILGVYLTRKRYGTRFVPVAVATANLQREKPTNKVFRIDRHGKRGALKRAAAWRRKQEAIIRSQRTTT